MLEKKLWIWVGVLELWPLLGSSWPWAMSSEVQLKQVCVLLKGAKFSLILFDKFISKFLCVATLCLGNIKYLRQERKDALYTSCSFI